MSELRALVLGGADCVWRDLEGALKLGEFDIVVAAKRVGEAYSGELWGWATLHPDTFQASVDARAANGYAPALRTYANRGGDGHIVYPFTRRIDDWGGSSGLLAVKVALEEAKATKVVCCGVPLDKSPHFDRVPHWSFHASYRKGWSNKVAHIGSRVRSMSGWTRELLGTPTRKWLNYGETTEEAE